MSSTFGCSVGIALLLISASVGGLARAAEPVAVPPSDGGMDGALRPFIDEHVIAGAVVLVTGKDHVLDLEAIGYSDLATRKPMQTTDLFYIASMTKCFTSAALMMLVDEGQVNIDDPVEKYLPEFKGQMVEAKGSGQRHPPQHPITIKEAMSHTAGLPKDAKPRHFNLEAEVKVLAHAPLKWEPGTKFEYSKGLEIAGRIVERVSGIPYCQFIQQRLLDPLEMKDTTFWPDAEQASHLALTHEYNSATKTLEPLHLNSELLKDSGKCGTVPPIILSQFPASMIPSYANHFARPSGSLFSTATDLSRFCRMLLSGGTYRGKKYLSPAAIKEMSSVQTADLAVGGKGLQGYGLGFFVQKKALAGGASVGSFGHHGSRKTQMWIDPPNQIAMILMVQCAELSSQQLNDLYAAYQKQAVSRYGQ
ncbi:MAG TPA: serine hydrolase domain-containing protein [Pirellulales bacterium]